MPFLPSPLLSTYISLAHTPLSCAHKTLPFLPPRLSPVFLSAMSPAYSLSITLPLCISHPPLLCHLLLLLCLLFSPHLLCSTYSSRTASCTRLLPYTPPLPLSPLLLTPPLFPTPLSLPSPCHPLPLSCLSSRMPHLPLHLCASVSFCLISFTFTYPPIFSLSLPSSFSPLLSLLSPPCYITHIYIYPLYSLCCLPPMDLLLSLWGLVVDTWFPALLFLLLTFHAFGSVEMGNWTLHAGKNFGSFLNAW